MDAFRQLVDKSIDGYLVIGEGGNVLYANAALAAAVGEDSAAHLIGRPKTELPWTVELLGDLDWNAESFRTREVASFRIPLEVVAEVIDFSGAKAQLLVLRDLSERKRLEAEVVRVSDVERERLARDLHDTLGQELAGITFKARALQQTLETHLPEEAPGVAEIVQHLTDAHQHARTLAHGLAPAVERQTLETLLRKMADTTTRVFRVPCSFRSEGFSDASEPVTINVTRIAHEAVSNAIRHGRARNISISLTAGDGVLTVRVEDDGSGFSPSGSGSGIGVRTMEFRARDIGGRFSIAPRPEGGTVVLCQVGPGG